MGRIREGEGKGRGNVTRGERKARREFERILKSVVEWREVGAVVVVSDVACLSSTAVHYVNLLFVSRRS